MALLPAHGADHRRHNQRDKPHRRHRRTCLRPVKRCPRVLRRVVLHHRPPVLLDDILRHRRSARAILLLQRLRRPRPPEKNLHGRHRKPHHRTHHLLPEPQARLIRAAHRPAPAQPARARLRPAHRAVLRRGARLPLPHPPRPQTLRGRPQPHPPQAPQRRTPTANSHDHHRALLGGGNFRQRRPLALGADNGACRGRHPRLDPPQHVALALHLAPRGPHESKELTRAESRAATAPPIS